MIGSDGPKTFPVLTKVTPKYNPKGYQMGLYSLMVPSGLAESSPKKLFALEMTPKWGAKKPKNDPQRTPKTGVENDLPHYYDEEPARAPFVRISVYSRVIVATFSLSF